MKNPETGGALSLCLPTLTLEPRALRDLSAAIAKHLAEAGLVGPMEPLAVSYATAARLLDLGCPETARNMANRGELVRAWPTSGAPRITMESIRACLARKAEAQEQAAA